MTSITRTDIRQRVGRAARCYQPITTTASGLSDGTTVIDSTRFRDQQLSALTYRNALVLVTSGTAAGEIRRVKSYDANSGTFTVTPPFSAQIASSVSAELYTLPVLQVGTCDGVEKEIIHQAIDDAINDVWYFWRHYLTLVTDGDMEASGTTNWTASSSTLTKSTTVVGEGKQSLRVQNSGANGYGRTANIAVFEDESYILEATFYANSGTPNLIAYDVTNSAAIDTLDAADSDQITYVPSGAWARLYTTLDIPSGCRAIQIRLAGEEASADIYWENIILRRAATTRETLPSWVTNENNVQQMVYRPLGNRYGREQWLTYPVDPKVIVQQPAFVMQEWEHDPCNHVLAVEGNRPNSALTTAGTAFATNDAVVAYGQEDQLLAVCMANLYDKLSARLGDNSAYNAKRQEWAAKVSAYTKKRSSRESQPLPQGSTYIRSGYWR